MNTVLLDKHDGFAVVTLNRPDAMNALSRELRADFVAAFGECSADPATRVVILTGNGKAFCAGFDLKELGDPRARAEDEGHNAVGKAMADFDGPVIGAINGHCITGGFEMALACDVLIASEGARFADTHARVGMLPGWGLSQKLPRLIGLSRAREMAFTGAPIPAQQAYEWGLVNRVLPADELLPQAMEMARNMCACVPEVLSAYRRLIDEGYSMPLDKALAWESEIAMDWSSRVTAEAIERRRRTVLDRGRSENG